MGERRLKVWGIVWGRGGTGGTAGDAAESGRKFFRKGGDVATLEFGLGEFLGAGLAGAVGAGDAGGTPRGSSFNLADIGQFRAGVGEASVD